MAPRLRRGLVTALLLLLVTATAAIAHPSFNPNQLPAGEAVDAVLVVPHGCNPEGGMPEEGQASPTIVLDLQLTEEIVELVAPEVDGWRVERVSEGEVVRWTATDGGTTEPIELPVTITIEGPVDEAIYLPAFQECEEGEFRWIGTPDNEAEFPAVKLVPTAGEIGSSQPSEGAHEGDEGEHAGESREEEATPGGDPTGTDPEDAAADGTGARDASAEAAASEGVSWVVVAVVVVVLVLGALLAWIRRPGGTA